MFALALEFTASVTSRSSLAAGHTLRLRETRTADDEMDMVSSVNLFVRDE
jgi:hypothetical protein